MYPFRHLLCFYRPVPEYSIYCFRRGCKREGKYLYFDFPPHSDILDVYITEE